MSPPVLVLVQFLQLTEELGSAVIVPIRNLFLLPDQLKILSQFLCCSDSQVNYIKLREASFKWMQVEFGFAVQTNGWFSCRPRSL